MTRISNCRNGSSCLTIYSNFIMSNCYPLYGIFVVKLAMKSTRNSGMRLGNTVPRLQEISGATQSKNDKVGCMWGSHDDVIKWKYFARYWPFVRGIHRSPVNSPHKGEWRGALMFSLICAWINAGVNNRKAGDLRHHRAYYNAIIMCLLRSHFSVLLPERHGVWY